MRQNVVSDSVLHLKRWYAHYYLQYQAVCSLWWRSAPEVFVCSLFWRRGSRTQTQLQTCWDEMWTSGGTAQFVSGRIHLGSLQQWHERKTDSLRQVWMRPGHRNVCTVSEVFKPRADSRCRSRRSVAVVVVFVTVSADSNEEDLHPHQNGMFYAVQRFSKFVHTWDEGVRVVPIHVA